MKYRQYVREVQIPQIICTPEERTKAAEIIAACVDKPVKRITHSSQLPGWKEPVSVDAAAIAARINRHAEKLMKYLQESSTPIPTVELDRLLKGAKEGARWRLRELEDAGLVKSELCMLPRNGGIRSVRCWTVA
jgi:dihydrodipicolinate synthase/N-acetylneuraminate lyase